MAIINIGIETEHTNHWSYEVQVEEGGKNTDYQVTLSFADYDLWSHGRVAPERVIKAVFKFLQQHQSISKLKAKFDCATLRRLFPQVDSELPTMI
jgi:hypothetical protein